MDLPTLIFVTIARPQAAIRLIKSIRSFFPSMPVHMVEQVDEESELAAICKAHGISRSVVPFDSGVSLCRNLAIEQVKTEYVVLADDDFVLTKDTRWDTALRFMSEHDEVAFVGGQLDGPDQRTLSRARNFAIDETGKGLLLIPAARLPAKQMQCDGESFQICDMVPQWGIARTRVLREVRWDERFKTGGEHLDFFLRLKRDLPAAKVASSNCIRAEHRQDTNEQYSALRGRDDWIENFAQKWGFEYILPAGGTLRLLKDYAETIQLWPDDAAANLIARQEATIARLREAMARQSIALSRKDDLIRRLQERLPPS